MGDQRQLRRLLKAIAGDTRLGILGELKGRHSVTVGALAKLLRMTHASVSRHLRILSDADIVRSARRGRFTAYRLALRQDPVVRRVLSRL